MEEYFCSSIYKEAQALETTVKGDELIASLLWHLPFQRSLYKKKCSQTLSYPLALYCDSIGGRLHGFFKTKSFVLKLLSNSRPIDTYRSSNWKPLVMGFKKLVIIVCNLAEN